MFYRDDKISFNSTIQKLLIIEPHKNSNTAVFYLIRDALFKDEKELFSKRYSYLIGELNRVIHGSYKNNLNKYSNVIYLSNDFFWLWRDYSSRVNFYSGKVPMAYFECSSFLIPWDDKNLNILKINLAESLNHKVKENDFCAIMGSAIFEINNGFSKLDLYNI